VGQRCTALSVVQGTAISSFDVDVLDVLDRGRPDVGRILVRVSGPAVDATGIGPGFSGSPVLCPDAAGVQRTAGAISETIGEFGGHTVLVTPIEAMLAQPVQPPAGTSARSASTLAGTARARFPRSRSLAAPLTLGGLSPRLSRAFVAAARRTGHTLVASPARPRAVGIPPQPMVPGASVFAGVSSGDVSLGALGAVTYVDGPSVWLFGHALDGAGRRSLFLQDARIHTVVDNPVGSPDLSTYKLGSAGNDLGTITGDGPSAVTGRTGALPGAFGLRVTAHDLDTGRRRGLVARVADEGDVGLPAGTGSLGLVAGAAVAEAVTNVLAGAPARQHGDLCMAVTLRELRAPMRFCNTYAVDGPVPNGLAGAALADVGAAAGLLDGYRFGTLHPTAVDIGVRVRRGLKQAFIVAAQAPRAVRRGRRISVRLRLRRTRTGATSTRTIRLRVPRDAKAGDRELRILGSPADEGRDPASDTGEDLVVLFDDGGGTDQSDDPGPASLAELRGAYSALGRRTGLRAGFAGRPLRLVSSDRDVRISGSARIPVRVRR
jgi:hypothetical protein